MKTKRSFFIITIVLLLSVTACSTSAFCESFASVSIEGDYVSEGKSDYAREANFTLESTDSSPMPDDSKEGVKEVSALPGESFTFGEISYQRPGVYHYIVRRVLSDSSNTSEDSSVFNVRAYVFSDGSVELVFEKEGDDGKTDRLLFKDSSDRTEGVHKSVKTGDDTSYLIYITLISAAHFCLKKCHFLLSGKDR